MRLVLRKTSRHAMTVQIKVESGLLIFNTLMALQLFAYRVVQKLKRIFKLSIY